MSRVDDRRSRRRRHATQRAHCPVEPPYAASLSQCRCPGGIPIPGSPEPLPLLGRACLVTRHHRRPGIPAARRHALPPDARGTGGTRTNHGRRRARFRDPGAGGPGLLVLVGVFVARGLFAERSIADPEPLPSSTVSGWDDSSPTTEPETPTPTPSVSQPTPTPTSTPTPTPSEELPLQPCPEGQPTARQDHPTDGRIHGGGLSFPEAKGWNDTSGSSFSWAYDVGEQMKLAESPSWYANLAVGALFTGDGFDEPRRAAELVMQCVITSGLYPYFTDRVDTWTKAVTVDGKPAWSIRADIEVDDPDLRTKGDTVEVIVVDTGSPEFAVDVHRCRRHRRSVAGEDDGLHHQEPAGGVSVRYRSRSSSWSCAPIPSPSARSARPSRAPPRSRATNARSRYNRVPPRPPPAEPSGSPPAARDPGRRSVPAQAGVARWSAGSRDTRPPSRDTPSNVRKDAPPAHLCGPCRSCSGTGPGIVSSPSSPRKNRPGNDATALGSVLSTPA